MWMVWCDALLRWVPSLIRQPKHVQTSKSFNCKPGVTSKCLKMKTAVKESMWLIHTFIHYHVQIVFRWYKAVVRLQCSPSCCLYCSKKRKYQHEQESRGTLANINYVLRRQADVLSDVTWGEKTAQKYQWAASALIKKRIKIHKMFYFKQHTPKTSGGRVSAFFSILSSSFHKLQGTDSQDECYALVSLYEINCILHMYALSGSSCLQICVYIPFHICELYPRPTTDSRE